MTEELPLFPLQTVLFPGGLLSLKVFEARYLDLASTCLREKRPFGVVALRKGQEVRRSGQDEPGAVVFEDVGVMAEILELDGAQPGILQLRCRGLRRFRIERTYQRADGLWVGEVEILPDDEPIAPAEAVHETVRGLANAIASLKGKGVEPFEAPYRFDDAGWVANRWCEILPIPLAAKQRLMELPDARVRLALVDEFLRGQGVVK
ncbi:MAG: LON peptidase substrate-binding domain-containing protein [Proteobacteria bacterium]|nr:LON peptidase substrate-binding domain-containing protein [Pseudomonadota bacterium]